MVAGVREARQQLSWADLIAEEPALAALEADIRRVKRQPGKPFCANACWLGYAGWPGFKNRLPNLVGWHARNPKLRTMSAYDVAYRHLYDLLPDCNGCGCF